jgi:hypothetical protein
MFRLPESMRSEDDLSPDMGCLFVQHGERDIHFFERDAQGLAASADALQAQQLVFGNQVLQVNAQGFGR